VKGIKTMMIMLLAAGRGERMRPLTDHTPKPLLEAGGKSLIVWHIEKLARAGLTELVINHAHLGEQIVHTLGDGKQYGVSIQYSAEGKALETAGGIANALHLLGDAPFAVVNADIYCDYDFTQLTARAATFKNSGDMAHLVLVNNPEQHPDGDFCLHGSRIVPNPQSPIPDPQPSILDPQSSILTFSGIGVYQPSLFQHISRGSIAPLAPLLREQTAAGKVSGEHYTGRWIDVGTPQRLQQLDNTLRATHNTTHV
jgi:MurNAc alpha-1-phosphate uridylyltransferase